MTSSIRRFVSSRSGLLGALLVLGGLLLGKSTIAWLASPDGEITSVGPVWFLAFQAALILPGLWLLIRRPKLPIPARLAWLPLAGATMAVLAGGYGTLGTRGVFQPPVDRLDPELATAWQNMLESEEVLLAITPHLARLGKGVMNLRLPDLNALDLFEESVRVVDVDSAEPDVGDEFATVGVGMRTWHAAEASHTGAPADFRMWTPVLEDIAHFTHAKFYPIRIRALNEAKTAYELDVGFSGLAKLDNGRMLALHGDQVVRIRRIEGEVEEDEFGWRIYDWRTDEVEGLDSGDLLFEEVLGQAVTDRSDRKRARRSIHMDLVTQFLLDGESFEAPHDEFQLAATDRHPGLSVVDLDHDGFDDLYVMARWGPNMLFRNLGDGTFEEIASEVGLDVEDHTSSAIFADFDNDGDTDAFLGRTLVRSAYLVNEDGHFVDRSDDLVRGALPYFASSVSAADFDQDGLLDVYVSTYAAQMSSASFELGGVLSREVLEGYISADDARRLHRLMSSKEYRRTVNHYGPPNVLLRNTGGGFELVDADATDVFRNTYQSTWADFDDDGDPDLYTANDYAPNNMIRNDGDGIFVDITDEVTADFGFGMGAGWGDYDNDGSEDLYVSNMYSKAGRRILDQLPTLDPRFAQGARGNSLLENGEDGFRLISGTTEPNKLVEVAGWSWSGQFTDLDNDGYLDVYALSGHYTAPIDIPGAVDI